MSGNETQQDKLGQVSGETRADCVRVETVEERVMADGGTTEEDAPRVSPQHLVSPSPLVPSAQFPSFRSFRPGMEDTAGSSDAASLTAERLLMSPTFFTDCFSSLERTGLVGEQKNALALYLVGTSRLLPRPMNVFVKGHSSTGKNHLVSRVLGLFPEDSYVEITSASEKAWHYSADSFRNKIVYIQEQNQASGSVHPVRLLISEGKLVRLVTVRKKGSEHNTSERFEARGPIAALSTTTQNRLEIDDETRHISLWMDASPEQTKRILRSYTRQPEPLSEAEVAAWRAVQELLATRTGIEIVLPTWFDAVAEYMVDAGHDVRLRRYFPAFCQACRTVALLRSFQRQEPVESVHVEFADFAIAHTLLDSVISESLHHEGGQTLETAQCIRSLMAKTGKSVRIQQIAEALNLPYKRAAERIQEAERAGLIELANNPEVRNVKRFVATSPQQLLPPPEALFRKLGLNIQCSFHHPLTGELVVYLPDTAETGKVVFPASQMVTVPSEDEKNSTARGCDRHALLDTAEQAGLVAPKIATQPSDVPAAPSSSTAGSAPLSPSSEAAEQQARRIFWGVQSQWVREMPEDDPRRGQFLSEVYDQTLIDRLRAAMLENHFGEQLARNALRFIGFWPFVEQVVTGRRATQSREATA